MRPAFAVLTVLLLIQTACVSLYVPALEQGNVLTADAVSQVKIGMTQRQVRFVLGTPLVADPFHQNRWDYYYLYKPNSEKGKPHNEHLTVLFKNEQVVKLERRGIPDTPSDNNKTD